jgi:hypothetical protein
MLFQETAISFKNSDNSVTAVLLNTSRKPMKVTLKGQNVPVVYRAFITQNYSPFAETTTVTNGSLVLPPRSVTTLYHSAANLAPTVDQASNMFVELPKGEKSIILTGIGYGADTATQYVSSVTASSSNPSVAGTLVNYSSESTSSVLKITPVSYGTTLITVKVKDDGGIAGGGIDSVLMKFYITVVSSINHDPTINEVAPVIILEDADSVRIILTGITDGDFGSQNLQFTISNSNEGLIPNPTINYVNGTDEATLVFKPVANLSGSANFTVILTDNGGDVYNNGNLSVKLDIPVTVLSVNDAPTVNVTIANTSLITGKTYRYNLMLNKHCSMR